MNPAYPSGAPQDTHADAPFVDKHPTVDRRRFELLGRTSFSAPTGRAALYVTPEFDLLPFAAAALLPAVAALALATPGLAQRTAPGPDAGESAPEFAPEGSWTYWGGDSRSARYSPLEAIDAENAGDLEVAWRWRAANYGPEPDYYYRATPVMADGKLFAVAGSRRAVVAIDPGTGETLWLWRMPENPRWEASPRKSYGKGLDYARVDGRGVLFTITPGYYLVALDAETGEPLQGFGRNGIVDLQTGLGDYPVHPDSGIPREHGLITSSAPPIVVNGVVVVGNSHRHGYYPAQKRNIPGHIRGYDARTGRMLWRFHVIPKPGEFGHHTWEEGSWKYTGNVSSWAPMSADPERGLVFVPTDAPTGDYYGGQRPGKNLFGTSLVALDVETGERVWHFQMVHHDIWNYDNPTAPNVVDVTVDGKRVPAVVQVTKQGWAYVFDRESGEPLWPIEEREVPASDVPGEEAWPTQPHPTKPPPFEIQGIAEDDLIEFTPELRRRAVSIAERYRMGPLFTPPSLRDAEDGSSGSFVVPGANGGANIGGGACADPETGILYVATERGHSVISLVPGEERPKYARYGPEGEPSDLRYVSTGPGGIRGPQGLPLLKPPYGSLVALDLNRGEKLWRIPNGDTPSEVADHPALEGVDLPRTGKRAHANCLVTATLLFYGEGRGGGPWFHAVDKETGEEVARVELPVSTNAAPITYLHEGRQYIVAPAAGPGHPAELVALALPED